MSKRDSPARVEHDGVAHTLTAFVNAKIMRCRTYQISTRVGATRLV
jgi:hypothetical protein